MSAPRRDAPTADEVLCALVFAIDQRGGVLPDGTPHAAPEWGELGEVYLLACSSLGITPAVRDVPPIDSVRAPDHIDAACSAWVSAVLHDAAVARSE